MTLDLDAITREVDRVRHVHAEIQNHARPGLVTGYLICVEQSADDVPWLCGRLTELVAEVRKLRAERTHMELNPTGTASWLKGRVNELTAEVEKLRADLAWLTDGPGPDITTVYDRDGDPWIREGNAWRHEGDGPRQGWSGMTAEWGPFTATPPAGGEGQ